MSIVNTETLQADTLVASDGDATKEVSIPSLKKNMAFAVAIFRTPVSGGVGDLTSESFNVSSITVYDKFARNVNFITKKSDTGRENIYGVAAGGHDKSAQKFIEVYHYQVRDTDSAVEIQCYLKEAVTQEPNIDSLDIFVY